MEIGTMEIKEDIKTFFMLTDHVPADIPALFEELGDKLNGLDGRHLYGVSECIGDKLIYRACTKEKYSGEAANYDLPYYIIPNGIYLYTNLKNWQENIRQMSQFFDELLKDPNAKKGSICFEDYTTENEALLLVEHK
jgi:hypothetical protein